MWDSSFWLELPKYNLNLKIWSQSLSPSDLKGCCTFDLEGPWDLEGCRTDLEGRCTSDLEGRRHATHPLSNKAEPSAISIVTQCSVRHPSRSHCAAPRGLRCGTPRGPRGTNFETKFSSLSCFYANPTKTSYPTPHFYPKYDV